MMSDHFWEVLFASLPPTVLALATLIQAFLNGREQKKRLTKTDAKMDVLHAAVKDVATSLPVPSDQTKSAR